MNEEAFRAISELMMYCQTEALKSMFKSSAPLQLFCKNCRTSFSRQEYWDQILQPQIDQAESADSHPLNYIRRSQEELLFAKCPECDFPSYWGEEK